MVEGVYDASQIKGPPPPWRFLPGEERDQYEQHLASSLDPAHPLSGEVFIAIARCEGCGDLVFSVELRSV